MRTRHKPDHEMAIMQRGLRELSRLSPEGRLRVVAYWNARAASLPVDTVEDYGEQQTDIEEHVPMMPRLKGAAA